MQRERKDIADRLRAFLKEDVDDDKGILTDSLVAEWVNHKMLVWDFDGDEDEENYALSYFVAGLFASRRIKESIRDLIVERGVT